MKLINDESLEALSSSLVSLQFAKHKVHSNILRGQEVKLLSVCVRLLAHVARSVSSPEYCLVAIGEAGDLGQISMPDTVFLVLGSANTQFVAGPIILGDAPDRSEMFGRGGQRHIFIAILLVSFVDFISLLLFFFIPVHNVDVKRLLVQ